MSTILNAQGEALPEKIKEVTVWLRHPETGKETKRVFEAPLGALFASSGIKRVLDSVVEALKEMFPSTNFVCFQEGASEFRFIPERAAKERVLRELREQGGILMN